MTGPRKRNAPSVLRSSNTDSLNGNTGQLSKKKPLAGHGKLAILMEMPIDIFLEVSRSFLDIVLRLLHY